MSRSYKKTPGWCRKTKGMKKFANKTVRNTKDIPNGGAFKKNGHSWDICDWKFLYFNKEELKETIEKYYFGEKYRFFMK